jgi:hypothetical protein
VIAKRQRPAASTVCDLLGRRVNGRLVRGYLRTLGQIEESSPDEEQGPERYVAVRSAGVELLAEGGIVQAVTLFQGDNWYSHYAGALPLGLRMDLLRAEVQALLGAPDFQMEATKLPHLGRVGPCDRYDGSGFSTAVDYDEHTGRIVKVQVMLPSAVPK